jgi:hypothetical protein
VQELGGGGGHQLAATTKKSFHSIGAGRVDQIWFFLVGRLNPLGSSILFKDHCPNVSSPLN